MKQKKISKRVVVITDNEELYIALERAFRFLLGMRCVRMDSKASIGKNSPILIILFEEQKVKSWLWEKIRKKYLNPVLVIGTEGTADFEKRNPVFKHHAYSHCYVQMPFLLQNIITRITSFLKPIYNQQERKLIYNSYSKCEMTLLKLLDHDLLKNKKGCIDIFLQVKEYFLERNDQKMGNYIDSYLEKIKKEEMWASQADQLAKILKDNIRGRMLDGK